MKVLTKSEPETLYKENRARGFIFRKFEPVSKTVFSETVVSYMIKVAKYKNPQLVAQHCFVASLSMFPAFHLL